MTLVKKAFIFILFAGAIAFIIASKPFSQTTKDTKKATALQSTLPDFTQFTDVKQKKTAFFDYMLPLIQQSNAEILIERTAIQAMDINQLSAQQKTKLMNLLKEYRIKSTKIDAQTKQTLLEKVDIIPASLALAQAANESAWGTSRFARQAFNFYGQWCFSKGCGLVPNQRTSGKTHEVKAFKTPYLSVKGYMHNLNSHHAFQKLREYRALARKNQELLTGQALVRGLMHYSERKEAYIKEVSAMIAYNKLDLYDIDF
mgnify:CR=1 FL=1